VVALELLFERQEDCEPPDGVTRIPASASACTVIGVSTSGRFAGRVALVHWDPIRKEIRGFSVLLARLRSAELPSTLRAVASPAPTAQPPKAAGQAGRRAPRSSAARGGAAICSRQSTRTTAQPAMRASLPRPAIRRLGASARCTHRYYDAAACLLHPRRRHRRACSATACLRRLGATKSQVVG
jgi:hypothetical protein